MSETETIEAEFTEEPDATPTSTTTAPPATTATTGIVTYSVTTAEIAKLAEKYKTVPADLSVKEDYKFVQKATAHLRGLRSDVEKRRKELKADALAWGKKVDATAKEITEKIVEIEEPLATAKKAYDTAVEVKKREEALVEERRVDGIAETIAGIKALTEANISCNSATIMEVINKVQGMIPCDEWAQEFAEKATFTINETLFKLQELHGMKLNQETAAANAAAEEKRRQEEAEAARIQRKKEVAEAEAKLAEERAEIAKIKADLAAQQRAIDDANAAALAEANRIKQEEEETQKRNEMAAEVKAEILAKLDNAMVTQSPPIHIPSLPTDYYRPAPKQASTTPNSTGYSEAYRATGIAILAIIGDKATTKRLLDTIIAGGIEHLMYTGELTALEPAEK